MKHKNECKQLAQKGAAASSTSAAATNTSRAPAATAGAPSTSSSSPSPSSSAVTPPSPPEGPLSLAVVRAFLDMAANPRMPRPPAPSLLALLDSSSGFVKKAYPGVDPAELPPSAPRTLQQLLDSPAYAAAVHAGAQRATERGRGILAAVKEKGAKEGDTLGKDEEQTLFTQVLLEAFGREVPSIVSSVALEQLAEEKDELASPFHVLAFADNLSTCFMEGLVSSKGKVGLQKELFRGEDGPQWIQAAKEEALAMALEEPKRWSTPLVFSSEDRERGPGGVKEAAGVGAGHAAAASSSLPSGWSAEARVRYSYLQPSEKLDSSCPALQDLIMKLHALPYEINRKLGSARAAGAAGAGSGGSSTAAGLLMPKPGFTRLVHCRCTLRRATRGGGEGHAQCCSSASSTLPSSSACCSESHPSAAHAHAASSTSVPQKRSFKFKLALESHDPSYFYSSPTAADKGQAQQMQHVLTAVSVLGSHSPDDDAVEDEEGEEKEVAAEEGETAGGETEKGDAADSSTGAAQQTKKECKCKITVQRCVGSGAPAVSAASAGGKTDALSVPAFSVPPLSMDDGNMLAAYRSAEVAWRTEATFTIRETVRSSACVSACTGSCTSTTEDERKGHGHGYASCSCSTHAAPSSDTEGSAAVPVEEWVRDFFWVEFFVQGKGRPAAIFS